MPNIECDPCCIRCTKELSSAELMYSYFELCTQCEKQDLQERIERHKMELEEANQRPWDDGEKQAERVEYHEMAIALLCLLYTS